MSIEEICEQYEIENYTINPDGSIDVDGSVDLNMLKLEEIPLQFNIVTENFYCNHNKLTTLKGSPKEVGGSFYCIYNEYLTSLKGAPKKVGDVFDCAYTSLTNLKYIPDCDTLSCNGCSIPFFEYRYIFMHKVNIIFTGNTEYNKILNRLLKEDKTIPEKIQELQTYERS